MDIHLSKPEEMHILCINVIIGGTRSTNGSKNTVISKSITLLKVRHFQGEDACHPPMCLRIEQKIIKNKTVSKGLLM